MTIRRSENYKQFGGVCSGYALSTGHSIALVRILTVLLLAASGGIIALMYIVAWIVLPQASTGGSDWDTLRGDDPLVRRSTNRFFGGVCGAIADYCKMDVSLVRLITILFAMIAGAGLWTYFYAWMILPLERDKMRV